MRLSRINKIRLSFSRWLIKSRASASLPGSPGLIFNLRANSMAKAMGVRPSMVISITPSGKSDFIWAAACLARVVLPMPPAPWRLNRRPVITVVFPSVFRPSRSSFNGCCRPTNSSGAIWVSEMVGAGVSVAFSSLGI